MRKNPDRTFRYGLLVLLVPAVILLLAGCSDEDSPVKNNDPPVINDLDIWYVNASASGADDGRSDRSGSGGPRLRRSAQMA